MEEKKLIPAIDNSLLEPIGAVTVNFAMLEESLSFGIWIFLFGNNAQEQRTGQIVTAELSFRRKVDLFCCLFRHRFPDKDDTELSKLRVKLMDVEAKRNRLVHSFWAASDEKGKSTRMKTTAKHKGIRFQFEKMGKEEIKSIADIIAEVAYETQMFYLNLMNSPRF